MEEKFKIAIKEFARIFEVDEEILKKALQNGINRLAKPEVDNALNAFMRKEKITNGKY